MTNTKRKFSLFVLILLPCFFLMIGAAQEIQRPPKKIVAAKPDLTVRIVAPSTAFPGAELGKRFYVQVKNIGPGSAKDIAVDIVLSREKIDPMKPAPQRSVDKYLKHKREKIKELKAGESINVNLSGNNKIPENLRLGPYWIAAMADRGNAIAELSEKNNLAVHELLIIAKIQGVIQHHHGLPTAELDISGQGFGSTAGNKQVYIGSNPASSILHWSSTSITVVAPSGITYGQDYAITIKQGSTTLSNMFNFLLRLWMDGVEPDNGPPGTSITLNGFHFGNAQGSKVLKLGTQTLNVTSWQNYQIQATIPNNATPGTHTLTIWDGSKLLSNEGTSFTVQ